MVVTCEKCERAFDDAKRWTICPHPPLDQPAPQRKEDAFATGFLSPREPYKLADKPPWWLYPISPLVLLVTCVCVLPFVACTMMAQDLLNDLRGTRRPATKKCRCADGRCRTNPNPRPEGPPPIVQTKPKSPPPDVRA